MRLKQLAVTACVLPVAVVAAIAIAVHFIDPRPFASSLAASVKADTGRELTFGDIGVELLPRPAIALSAVRFGNAAWGSQPWLAQAGRVSANIDVLALLARRVRINRIVVSDANLFLETDRDGNGNWLLGRAEGAAPEWLKKLEIDEFALQALAIGFRSGATGKTASARLESARVFTDSASSPLHLSARASYEGKSLFIRAPEDGLSTIHNLFSSVEEQTSPMISSFVFRGGRFMLIRAPRGALRPNSSRKPSRTIFSLFPAVFSRSAIRTFAFPTLSTTARSSAASRCCAR